MIKQHKHKLMYGQTPFKQGIPSVILYYARSLSIFKGKQGSEGTGPFKAR